MNLKALLLTGLLSVAAMGVVPSANAANVAIVGQYNRWNVEIPVFQAQGDTVSTFSSYSAIADLKAYETSGMRITLVHRHLRTLRE